MPFGFSGNLGALDRMAGEIGRMGERMMSRVAREGRFEIERELARTLGAKQTPDGKPWAPRKDGKALADMTGAVKVTAKGTDIVARTIGKAAALHHEGTSRMPARPLLPGADAELPRAWELGLDRAVQRSGTFFMRGRG